MWSNAPLVPPCSITTNGVFCPVRHPAPWISRVVLRGRTQGRQPRTRGKSWDLFCARLSLAHSINRLGSAPRFKFQISNFKFQISNVKSQISNLKSQISNLKSQIEQLRHTTCFLYSSVQDQSVNLVAPQSLSSSTDWVSVQQGESA